MCWEFRARLVAVLRGIFSDAAAQRFALNLVVAFLPAGDARASPSTRRSRRISSRRCPSPARSSLGAFVILWAERRQRLQPSTIRIATVDEMRWTDALKVGCAQAFALIPGTSRSGATIIGGMLFGLSRVAATEFSFFLAIPTLFAATGYSLWKDPTLLDRAGAAGVRRRLRRGVRLGVRRACAG